MYKKFAYSNTDYIVLGAWIEKVTNEPYGVSLRKTIFDPLKMTNTGYDLNYPQLPDHATGYSDCHIKADYDPLFLSAGDCTPPLKTSSSGINRSSYIGRSHSNL